MSKTSNHSLIGYQHNLSALQKRRNSIPKSRPNLETGDNDPLWVLRSSVYVTLRILRDYMVCWLSLEVKAGKFVVVVVAIKRA